MKYIKKRAEPLEIIRWKNSRQQNNQPMFENLRGKRKKILKKSLLEEQGYLCCYCENQTGEKTMHVEHFRPQSDPAVDSVDYSNMLCSCISDHEKGEPQHCGHLKGEWFDNTLLISPLNPSCEGRFAYTADGGIRAADSRDKAASTTIEKLGLDINKLRNAREKAIEPFIDCFTDEKITVQEFIKFVTGYLKKDEEGKFPPFFTTIRYLFAK